MIMICPHHNHVVFFDFRFMVIYPQPCVRNELFLIQVLQDYIHCISWTIVSALLLSDTSCRFLTHFILTDSITSFLYDAFVIHDPS